jgi:hypothetical protein
MISVFGPPSDKTILNVEPSKKPQIRGFQFPDAAIDVLNWVELMPKA